MFNIGSLEKVKFEEGDLGDLSFEDVQGKNKRNFQKVNQILTYTNNHPIPIYLSSVAWGRIILKSAKIE